MGMFYDFYPIDSKIKMEKVKELSKQFRDLL